MTIGTVINDTATKVPLLLDDNDAGHAASLPPTMWFKGGFESHSGFEHIQSVYATEAAGAGNTERVVAAMQDLDTLGCWAA